MVGTGRWTAPHLRANEKEEEEEDDESEKTRKTRRRSSRRHISFRHLVYNTNARPSYMPKPKKKCDRGELIQRKKKERKMQPKRRFNENYI